MAEYPKITLTIKKTLGAGEIILRDAQINEILANMKKTGSSEFFKTLIDELGNDEERRYAKEGDEIKTIIEMIISELKMCSLSLYLFEKQKENEANISEEVHAYNRDKPIEGVPDWEFQKIPGIYGHGFVYSLHKIQQCLEILGSRSDSPQLPKPTRKKINKIKIKFDKKFEGLRAVRNSWQHKEDRMRGLTQIRRESKKSKIPGIHLKVDSWFRKMLGLTQIQRGPNKSKIPGKLLIVGSWIGNKLTYTHSDGSIVSLSVSRDSFDILQSHIQGVFDSIEWVEGCSELDPSITKPETIKPILPI